MKDYRRAAADFRTVTNLDAAHKLAWNHLGLCLNALGDVPAALDAYRRAIAIDPQFKEGYSNMAQSYKDFGDYEKAERFFSKALSFDPNFVAALHLRSLARYGVGAHCAALEDLEKVLSVGRSGWWVSSGRLFLVLFEPCCTHSSTMVDLAVCMYVHVYVCACVCVCVCMYVYAHVSTCTYARARVCVRVISLALMCVRLHMSDS
jgi:tetratricopeptide (TPR) repeat protein